MLNLLRQSTAATVRIGPFVDATDAVTAEAALAIQKANVRLSKNGGNYAAASANQGAADAGAPYDEVGEYDIALDVTDTGTLGRLRVNCAMSGALPVWKDFMVVPAAVYDGLVAGTGTGVRSDVQAMAANVLTAAAIADGAITTAKIADGLLTAAKFAAGAFDAAWSVATRLLTAGTNIVLAKGVGLTGLNDIAAGTAMTLTAGERTAVANEVEAQIIDDTDTEKVLEAIVNKIAEANPDLDGLTLSAIAVAVRTELATEMARIDVAISTRLATAGYTVPPTAPANATAVRAELAVELGRLDAAVTTRATPAQVATELATYDAPTKAELDAAQTAITNAIAALNNLSSADVDALLTTTARAELAAPPAANASLAAKLTWLAMLARNAIEQTTTEQRLKSDAGATIATAAVSDAAGVFTRGEFAGV